MRARRLAGLEGWLQEQFHRHRGNAEVVRQELARVHGVGVSRRTVERAVAGWRQALRAEVRATVRFETPAGQPLQVDFGTARVGIDGEAAAQHFAGVPEEVLLDNAKALVVHHDLATREVELHARFQAFAR